MLKLSIIIPAFNEAKILPTLLASLQKQTFRPHEIMVADAHSTDATREVATSFGARVVDGGMPGSGRNRGAEVATGEYLLFLDADVVIEDPAFIEKAMKEMEERQIDLGVPRVLPDSGRKLDEILHAIYNTYVHLLERIRPHAPGFCLFVKRSAHEAIHGFDETVTFCEDHDYAIRLHKAGFKFRFLHLTIPTSTRRFERDGHFRTSIKFFLAEIYMWVFGPIRNDLFHYTFGHDENDKK